LKQNGEGSLTLLSRWLLLKVLEVKFLKILKVDGANDSDKKQAIANK
jgi:hypothetical protein